MTGKQGDVGVNLLLPRGAAIRQGGHAVLAMLMLSLSASAALSDNTVPTPLVDLGKHLGMFKDITENTHKFEGIHALYKAVMAGTVPTLAVQE